MNLVETGSVAAAELPLAEFRAHLRLGTGFGEDTLQDSVLEGYLRAAVAAVEARTNKVLIARGFELAVTEWSEPACQLLPRAPVVRVDEVAVRRANDGDFVVNPEGYWVKFDQNRPLLCARGAALPALDAEGAVVSFTAGFGPWAEVPADLQQAVLLLAAHYYEYRAETALARGCMPFGVTSLLERYRPVRLGMGRL